MAKTLFLGVEGSGKTTLAMALARAFARHEGSGWYLRPQDRGAYNFATIAPEDFARDGFPRQTANVREMTWRIEKDGADQGTLEILDYPGEVYRLAFLEADDEPDPVAFRERAQANEQEISRLRAALGEATRVFVLFNLQDALDLRGNDANRSAVWVTNESLKAVKALPSKPQVTLVFTQVDRYQTADDFLHTFTPKDLDLVGHDHPDVDWTMVSVMVPPESEFGVDAFVRRCTGLAAFGVPTGRPVDPAAAKRGESLRGLAAAGANGGVAAPARNEPAPSAPAPAPAPRTPAPATGASLRPFIWGTGVLVAVMTAVTIGEVMHVRARRGQLLAEQARLEQEVAKAAQAAERKAAAEAQAVAAAKAAAERKVAELKAAAEKAASEAKSNAPAAPAPSTVGTALRAVRDPAPAHVAPSEAKSDAPAAAPAAASDVKSDATAAGAALGRRLGAAALDAAEASVRAERAKLDQAGKRLAEALAAATPQAAHDALCDAAEAGLPAAQERLARVYDIWGWGGYVRTKEEAGARWPDWLRRIDFPKDAKAVPVSRPAPNAEQFRKLAGDWYRLAAENGVAAAAEALRRHGEEPPEPESRVPADAVKAARALAAEAESEAKSEVKPDVKSDAEAAK